MTPPSAFGRRPVSSRTGSWRGSSGFPATEWVRLLAALEEVVELIGAEELDAAPMLIPGSDVSPRGNGN